MTNLIEKILLIGFGIFTLTIFSSILIPFIGRLTEFNFSERSKLEFYMITIDEINQGIEYIVQNRDEIYLKKIEYPDSLNITFYDQIAKFEFSVEGKLCYKIIEYKYTFITKIFHNILPQTYLLNISCIDMLIEVDIIKLYY
ncbi:MAG: hypothetical protein ACFFDY_03265 [Candidatus Thorarchaeota archaeon]